MLKVSRVSKRFGEKEILHNVSFSLGDGEIAGLVGPSGGGKSVLLKIVGGVLSPDSGTIECVGDQTSEGFVVGFLFQEGGLFDSLTVLENVAFPLLCEPSVRASAYGSAPIRRVPIRRVKAEYDEAMERAYEILGEVGLSQAWKKVPGQLSGGMRRRVGIARALVSRPSLALLDDPTGGLDPVAASVIMNLIKKLHEHYSPTIIMVSHDIRRLLPNVNRVLGLFSGSIMCDETTEDVPSRAPDQVVSFLATRYDFPSALASGSC